jgi:hypothetical protein
MPPNPSTSQKKRINFFREENKGVCPIDDDRASGQEHFRQFIRPKPASKESGILSLTIEWRSRVKSKIPKILLGNRFWPA